MADKRRLLMIDDDAQLCAAVKTKLEKTGCYTVAFSSLGSQVQQLIHQHQPELIILDIDMPDMPGDEVAELIQSDPRTRDIPVLFLSSVVTPQDVEATGGMIGDRQIASKRMSLGALIERIQSMV